MTYAPAPLPPRPKWLVPSDLDQLFYDFRAVRHLGVPQFLTRPLKGIVGLIDETLDILQSTPLRTDISRNEFKGSLDACDINAGVRRTRCFQVRLFAHNREQYTKRLIRLQAK